MFCSEDIALSKKFNFETIYPQQSAYQINAAISKVTNSAEFWTTWIKLNLRSQGVRIKRNAEQQGSNQRCNLKGYELCGMLIKKDQINTVRMKKIAEQHRSNQRCNLKGWKLSAMLNDIIVNSVLIFIETS